MTDDLIAWLRTSNNIRDHEAAAALEAQARRIAELRKEADMMHSEYKTARARIAELEAALKQSARVEASLASRIANLMDALEPFADLAETFPYSHPFREVNIGLADLRAARAAYLGDKE